MKVLCCGDRHWTDAKAIRKFFDDYEGQIDLVIEGECRGADIMCRDEAKCRGISIDPHPANWDRYGRAAGPIRNRQMLDEEPDLVVAFHNNLEKSKGTVDTVKEARKRGFVVILIKEAPTKE